jgi:hypothetical protein
MPLVRLHSTALDRKEQSQGIEPNVGQQNSLPQITQSPAHKHRNYEQEPSESIIGSAVRGGARTLKTVGSRVGGLAGDVLSAGTGIAQFLTGGEEGPIASYSKIQEKIPFLPPTSDQFSNKVDKLTGGYTASQSKTERFIDDLIGDIASIFIPAKLKVPFQGALSSLLGEGVAAKVASAALPFAGSPTSLKTATKLGVAGGLAAKGTEELGGSPAAQGVARAMGTVLAAIPGTRARLEKSIPNIYQEAINEVSHPTFILPGNTVEANGIIDGLESLLNKLEKQHSPNIDLARQEITGMIKAARKSSVDSGLKSSAGQAQKVIPVQELVKLKQGANQFIELTSRPRFEGEKYLPKNIRPIFGEAGDIFSKPLNKYAQSNPKFGEKWNLAEELFKGFNDLEPATRFLKENITLKDAMGSNAAKAGIFGGTAYGLGLPAALGSLGAAKVTKDFMLMRNLITKSPTAKQAYLDVIKFAANQNRSGVAKSLSKFDHEMQRYEYKLKQNKKSKFKRVNT